MLKWFSLVSWFILSSIEMSQESRVVFGVKISMEANAQMKTYVVYITNGYTVSNRRYLNESEFIKFASGIWPSIYNPKRKNLFAEQNLNCGTYKDTITFKDLPYCSPLDSLWKLRFSTFPFLGRTEAGWSNKLQKPSQEQEAYLYSRYNVSRMDSDFFLDTNFWKLLKDVEDPIWIKNYKSL
jgi:hypothetical protein